MGSPRDPDRECRELPARRGGRGRTLPRYFFDIADEAVVIDASGRELADPTAARAEALARAADYAADPAKLGGSGILVVTVREAPDTVLMRLRLVCQVEDLTG